MIKVSSTKFRFGSAVRQQLSNFGNIRQNILTLGGGLGEEASATTPAPTSLGGEGGGTRRPQSGLVESQTAPTDDAGRRAPAPAPPSLLHQRGARVWAGGGGPRRPPPPRHPTQHSLLCQEVGAAPADGGGSRATPQGGHTRRAHQLVRPSCPCRVGPGAPPLLLHRPTQGGDWRQGWLPPIQSKKKTENWNEYQMMKMEGG